MANGRCRKRDGSAQIRIRSLLGFYCEQITISTEKYGPGTCYTPNLDILTSEAPEILLRWRALGGWVGTYLPSIGIYLLISHHSTYLGMYVRFVCLRQIPNRKGSETA